MEATVKSTDKTTYMREYKRQQYAKKGEQMREKNKAYYYKYKYKLTGELMKKYDTLLPLCIKLIKNLEALKEQNPEFLEEILSGFTKEEEEPETL